VPATDCRVSLFSEPHVPSGRLSGDSSQERTRSSQETSAPRPRCSTTVFRADICRPQPLDEGCAAPFERLSQEAIQRRVIGNPPHSGATSSLSGPGTPWPLAWPLAWPSHSRARPEKHHTCPWWTTRGRLGRRVGDQSATSLLIEPWARPGLAELLHYSCVVASPRYDHRDESDEGRVGWPLVP
jgi:hypothetical protein